MHMKFNCPHKNPGPQQKLCAPRRSRVGSRAMSTGAWPASLRVSPAPQRYTLQSQPLDSQIPYVCILQGALSTARRPTFAVMLLRSSLSSPLPLPLSHWSLSATHCPSPCWLVTNPTPGHPWFLAHAAVTAWARGEGSLSWVLAVVLEAKSELFADKLNEEYEKGKF